MMPMHSIVNVIDDPPELTSGIGIPVTGINPVTAPMLMMACATSMAVSPPASTRPYASRAPSAIRIPA